MMVISYYVKMIYLFDNYDGYWFRFCVLLVIMMIISSDCVFFFDNYDS